MAFFGPGCACRGPLKRYCRSKDGCAGFQYNESVLCSGCYQTCQGLSPVVTCKCGQPLDAKKCKNPKRCARIPPAGKDYCKHCEGKCDSSSSSGQSTSKHKGSSTSSKQPCVCKGSPSCKDPRHCKSTTGSSAELQCSACRAAGCPSASTSTYPPGNSGSYGAGSGTDTDYDTGYATGLSAGYDAGYAAGYGAVYGLDNYSAY